MAKFGLDFGTLSAIDCQIVYVSLSGFGSDGPRAQWGSHGTLIEAASSIESRTGYVGGEPMKLGHPLPDGVGGTAGAFATLRGLRTLSETGEGSYFDISQLETYCAAGGKAVLATSLDGLPAHAVGNASPLVAAQNVYPCRGEDEWVAISISDDDEWSSLQSILTASSVVDRGSGPYQRHSVMFGRPSAASGTAGGDRCRHRQLDPDAGGGVPGHDAAGRGDPSLSGDDLL